jgi:pimeloyl-ACP methyl ester carboxylesterase
VLVTSLDQTDKVLTVAVATDRGTRNYLLRDGHEPRFLGENRLSLIAKDLAPTAPITYTARDGLTIHGYLTLPVGAAPQRLPTVLLVHGGPWARDRWGDGATSRTMQQFLANRGYAVLQVNYRGSSGYGRNHPFAGEIRSGYVAIEIVPEELGFTVNIGELLMTECEMVNGFVAPESEPPHFTRGYGLTFGMSERKAMAMALVDRALQAPDYGEEIAGPAQDEEFVLAHADNVEAAGFVSHLKLPHYVDFQAELALLKRLQRENERG